jgi:acetyltransferase
MSVVADAPTPLIPECSATLVTRRGLELHVRPAAPEDEATVRTFFAELRPDDLRFRFLSPLPRVGESLYGTLLRVDHVRTEDFLAFVDDRGRRRMVASAMLSCDPDTRKAEVAISVHPAYRNKGIGWTLLDFIARDAKQRGMEILQSVECPDNRGALEVEKALGFQVSFYPGDPTLTLVSKQLGKR